MNKIIVFSLGIGVSFLFGFSMNAKSNNAKANELKTKHKKEVMNDGQIPLGVFSISLNVKDINVSKKFYEDLGFVKFGGDLKMNYVIMKNDKTVIGLFQGMFEDNIMTFNPGWDENGKNIESFTDIRDIQKDLKSKGVKLDLEADESTKGPASVMLKDPDGNIILLDQHR